MNSMPAMFIGHGSPMNALELNGFTRAWRAFGRSVPRPRAILVVSAHWYIEATAVTAMTRPRTIHDFYGFPQPLFDFSYPAVGAPDVAREIVEAVKPTRCELDETDWGLDHGAWSVLAHLFPQADVPVVQLSIDASKPFDLHLALGARLSVLRASGILIVCSGNIVHNLPMVDWRQPDHGYAWARRFDAAAFDTLTTAPGDILRLRDHPDFAAAAPTPDHFLPLLYLAGLAAEEGRALAELVRGYALGSLSMSCYGLDMGIPDTGEAQGAAGLPRFTPPDQTNT